MTSLPVGFDATNLKNRQHLALHGRMRHGVPTSHPPGSEGKIRVLELRAALGLLLFNPQDAKFHDRLAFSVASSGSKGFATALLGCGEGGILTVLQQKAVREKRIRTPAEKQAAFANREADKMRKRVERQTKRDRANRRGGA